MYHYYFVHYRLADQRKWNHICGVFIFFIAQNRFGKKWNRNNRLAIERERERGANNQNCKRNSWIKPDDKRTTDWLNQIKSINMMADAKCKIFMPAKWIPFRCGSWGLFSIFSNQIFHTWHTKLHDTWNHLAQCWLPLKHTKLF